MGSTKKTPILLIFYFSFIFVYSGHNLLDQDILKEWKGEITESKGVKIIKNPAEPLYGEITLDLELDLEFGNEVDDNYYFYGSVEIDVDSKGNFYVLDHKEIRIHKFGPDGKFIRAVGRKGQGPGEFERPYSIGFDSQDNFYVQESKRINIFSNKGDRLATITSRQNVDTIVPFTPNSLLAVHSQYTQKGPSRQLVLIDGSGEILKNFAAYQDKISTIRKGRAIINIGGYHKYKHMLYTSDYSPGYVIYAHSSEYRLYVIDERRGIAAEIRVDEPPLPLTSKEKDKEVKSYIASRKKRELNISHSEAMQAHNFPENKPYFRRILSDGQGFLFVLRKLGFSKKPCTFDLFNSEGIFIYRISTPSFPDSIKNGFFYDARLDSEKGFLIMQRFKIKNWTKLKIQSN